ncbi:Hypothetical_protein [Hexamita inflata]|uniref:Hypothetical_protein n=1 Tax=Hexamita inflata TaxID=28002 RepID=A0AA86QPX6_9EUKA|nr:Hypothetical protein HINF_LOCUS51319 [Hexamita inflata]
MVCGETFQSLSVSLLGMAPRSFGCGVSSRANQVERTILVLELRMKWMKCTMIAVDKAEVWGECAIYSSSFGVHEANLIWRTYRQTRFKNSLLLPRARSIPSRRFQTDWISVLCFFLATALFYLGVKIINRTELRNLKLASYGQFSLKQWFIYSRVATRTQSRFILKPNGSILCFQNVNFVKALQCGLQNGCRVKQTLAAPGRQPVVFRNGSKMFIYYIRSGHKWGGFLRSRKRCTLRLSRSGIWNASMTAVCCPVLQTLEIQSAGAF